MARVPEGPKDHDIGSLAGSAAKLLGSGVVSALALTIITSNRWHLLDPDVGVTLVLFLQWQVLGVTVTKMGLDQVIFAAISANPSRTPATTSHMWRRALPLAVAFGVLVSFVFDAWVGLACFMSLLLDTQTVLTLSALNARERYTDVTTASLLNYPLFFLLLFSLQTFRPVTVGVALGLFVLTSLIRWAWVRVRYSADKTLPTVSFQGTALTGIAPLMNFLMFRGDQVLLGTAMVTTFLTTVSSDLVRQLLFLGRYQELLSGGLTLLTGILLPRLHVAYPFATRDLGRGPLRRRWWLALSYVLAVGLPLVGYSFLWRGSPLPAILLASAAISALLILPANALTYSMIRQGYLRGLVRNLAIAIAVGLAAVGASFLLRAPMILVLTVPLQLGVFVGLALTSSWLTHQQPYE